MGARKTQINLWSVPSVQGYLFTEPLDTVECISERHHVDVQTDVYISHLLED